MSEMRVILVCRRCGREPRWDGMVQVDSTHLVPKAYVTEAEWCLLCMGEHPSAQDNTDSPGAS